MPFSTIQILASSLLHSRLTDCFYVLLNIKSVISHIPFAANLIAKTLLLVGRETTSTNITQAGSKCIAVLRDVLVAGASCLHSWVRLRASCDGEQYSVARWVELGPRRGQFSGWESPDEWRWLNCMQQAEQSYKHSSATYNMIGQNTIYLCSSQSFSCLSVHSFCPSI